MPTKPATTALTETLMPDFIESINNDYKSQVAHVFLLHGNIYDFCDNSGKDLTVKQVFARFYDDNFQKDTELEAGDSGNNLGDSDQAPASSMTRILVTYNLSQGLEIPNPQSKELMRAAFKAELGDELVNEQFMRPKSIGKLVDFMNLWFDISKKRKKTNQLAKKTGKSPQELLLVTWLLTDTDSMFPQGEISSLGPDRLPIVSVRQWAQDEWLASTNRIILMCRHVSDLHESIRSEISAIHMVRKPNLEDRLQYINGFDKTIQARAKTKGGSLKIGKNTSVSKINWADDFGPQQCAVQSAGMNRKQLKDVFLQSWMQMEPVGYDQVRARKQRALQDEYQGMIDFKEPEFGFEEIGGHEGFKKFCKQQIIMPLQTGDKRTCARGALMVGPPGCQPAGSKVLLANGLWKLVEDIQVGDKVLSPQQDDTTIVSTVTEVVSYPDRDIYEVATKGRSRKSYLCADNHIVPFLYLERPRVNSKRRPRRYKLAEIQASKFASLGINRKKVTFTSPAVDLPELEFDIHPYIMGALLGDRSFIYNPSFTGSQAMLKKLRSLGAITGKGEYEKGNSFSIHLTGETGKLMKKSPIWGKDSYNKFVPDDYMRGSLSQRLDLLAGLIDTDGSIDSFTSCSKQLAEDFVNLVHSVGGFANYKERVTKDQNGTSCLSFRAHYAFAELRPELVYKHKDRGPRNMNWKNPRRRDFTVKKAGKGTVFGFVLDSPSEWYITDDWMVTHNTGKSTLAWALAKEAKMNYLIVDLSKVFGGLVGESLYGDQEIYFSDKFGRQVERKTIREAYETGHLPYTIAFSKFGGFLIQKVEGVVRHDRQEKFVKITTQRGKEVIVTEGHSVFTRAVKKSKFGATKASESGYLTTVAAGTLTPGVPLATIGYWNSPDKRGSSSLSEVDTQNLRVKLSIPLMELIGFYLGDGSKHGSSLRLSLGPDDQEIVDILRQFGEVSNYKDYRSQAVNYTLHTDDIYVILQELGVTGKHKSSYNKRVPAWVFGADDEHVAALLRGYFSMDGSFSGHNLEVTSASSGLAEDISLLLSRFGIASRLEWIYVNSQHRYHRRVIVSKGAELETFALEIGFVQKYKNTAINSYLDKIGKKITSRGKGKHKRRYSICWDEVAKIEPFESDDPYSYDLCVPGPQNFMSNGMVLHNTESNMRKLLEAIEASAPCIVFIDELDSVLSSGRTSAGDSGTSGRVFNSFMTFMSDPGRVGKIVILAASNRPDLLDAALIRAGRFDAKIAILPPGRGDIKGRKDILKALTTKHKVKFAKELAPTLENKETGLGRLLEDAERIWTGAEIEIVIKKSISTAAFAGRKDEDGNNDYTIQIEDWDHAMDVIIPNTNEVEFQTKLALYYVDDLDFVPKDYRAMALDKNALRAELGMIRSSANEDTE